MTALSIRRDFHTDLAATVAADIQYRRSNYYYFLGKVEAWGVGDTSPTVAEIDSNAEDLRIRSNALFIRKINSGDTSFVTTRHDWVSGTVYAVWDHTKSMRGEAFYVVTSAKDVYKCLSNNGGAQSTVEPSDRAYSVTTTADGYIWKFMYSIPSFKESKFMTSTYVPVQKSLSDNFYSRGAVDFVNIISGGTGYTSGIATTITATGATSGSGAAGTVSVGAGGIITGFNLTSGGTGYTSGVNLSVTTTNGTGAVLEAVIVAGVITGITIVSGGSGYVTGDLINFNLGGAILVPSIDSTGRIQNVTIVDGGIGYSGSVTLTVNSSTGSGAYGNPNAILTAIVYQGSIVHVNIIDPGTGLEYQTATTITVSGNGTGAVFRPVVSGGKIIDVITENAGQNYTTITLSVVGTGVGAMLTPIMTTSDYTSTQSIIEQTTTKGAIYHAVITNGGNNYSPSTTIAVVGDGTGAVAVPTIVNGSITKITMTTYGQDYTYASFVVTDPFRSLIGTVVDLAAYPTLPPLRGHGYDAISELYGETLAIHSNLRQETALNTLLQDYRQFGILKNPTTAYTDNLFTGDTSLIAYTAQFNSVVGIVMDEVLTLNQYRFRVAGITGQNVILQPLGVRLVSPVGVLVAESNNTRSYNSLAVISSPSVNKYSGKLLYVSDENPFSFTPEQGVVIKTFLKF